MTNQQSDGHADVYCISVKHLLQKSLNMALSSDQGAMMQSYKQIVYEKFLYQNHCTRSVKSNKHNL